LWREWGALTHPAVVVVNRYISAVYRLNKTLGFTVGLLFCVLINFQKVETMY